MAPWLTAGFRACAAVLIGMVLSTGGAFADQKDDFLSGKTINCPACDLTGINLKLRDDLATADFSGAILVGANFHRSNLERANFFGADLRDADLNKTEL